MVQVGVLHHELSNILRALRFGLMNRGHPHDQVGASTGRGGGMTPGFEVTNVILASCLAHSVHQISPEAVNGALPSCNSLRMAFDFKAILSLSVSILGAYQDYSSSIGPLALCVVVIKGKYLGLTRAPCLGTCTRGGGAQGIPIAPPTHPPFGPPPLKENSPPPPPIKLDPPLQVIRFKIMNQSFLQRLQDPGWSVEDRVDLVFQFQAFMLEEVYAAQRRVSEKNSFTFCGLNTPNEAGHVANLTNQLRTVLYDVRTMALAYQTAAGVSALRKCPHCGQVWTKVEGCDGQTTCGNRLQAPDGRLSMADFEFFFDGEHLQVQRMGERLLAQRQGPDGHGAGCGRTIVWSQMAPVDVGEDVGETVARVHTDDVLLLPRRALATFADVYNKIRNSFGALATTGRQ